MAVANNLFILISIVYGLAITRLLEGFALIARPDVKVKIDPIHLSWVILLFVVIIENWWSVSISNPLMDVHSASSEPFTFWEYVFFLSRPVFLYLLAVMLVPSSSSEKILDLKKHYHQASSWIFGVVGLMAVRGFLERHLMKEENFGIGIDLFSLFIFCSAVMLAVSDNRKIHGIFVILLFAVIIGFSIFVTLTV